MFGNFNGLMLMGTCFSQFKRSRYNFFNKVLIFFFQLFFLIFFWLAYSNLSYAAPQTPSQALPKMFQKPPGLDYYQFKKQEKVIPEIPQVQVTQQQDTGIKINLRSLIILAPPELQNIIDKEKYYKMLIGVPQSINDLYNLLKVVGFSKKHILNPTKFNDLIKYCMLRRTKISVGLQQQLPGLKENNIFVPFNNENEKKLAELIHRNLSDEPNQYISCQNLISRHHFSDLMRQRQVCLSTNLIGNALKKKKKKNSL